MGNMRSANNGSGECSIGEWSLSYLLLTFCLLTVLTVGIIFGFAGDFSDIHDGFVAAAQFAAVGQDYDEVRPLGIIDRQICLPLTSRDCAINRSPPDSSEQLL
jgi:hypothetical protein